MTKPIYMTTIVVKTEQLLVDGTVLPYRETIFSIGAKQSKTRKEANIWHNYLNHFLTTLQNVVHKVAQ